MRFPTVSRRRWLLAGLGVLVFLAGWSLAVVRTPRTRLPAAPPPGRAATAEQAGGPALQAGATVHYRTVYFPSGRTEESDQPAPPALVGMRLQDLRTYYPQWRVVQFTPGRVVLEQELPEPWRHVRVEDGEVVVRYGLREHLGPIRMRTGIQAARLPAVDRRRLEEGVDLKGDEAVRTFLESDAP